MCAIAWTPIKTASTLVKKARRSYKIRSFFKLPLFL